MELYFNRWRLREEKNWVSWKRGRNGCAWMRRSSPSLRINCKWNTRIKSGTNGDHRVYLSYPSHSYKPVDQKRFLQAHNLGAKVAASSVSGIWAIFVLASILLEVSTVFMSEHLFSVIVFLSNKIWRISFKIKCDSSFWTFSLGYIFIDSWGSINRYMDLWKDSVLLPME